MGVMTKYSKVGGFPMKDPYDNEPFKPFDLDKYRTFKVDELKISYLMVMMTGAESTIDIKQERADFRECMDFLVLRGMMDRVDSTMLKRGWRFRITSLGNEMAEEFLGYGSGQNLLLNNLKDKDDTGFTLSGRNPFVSLFVRYLFKSMEDKGLMKKNNEGISHITKKGADFGKEMLDKSDKKFREDFK